MKNITSAVLGLSLTLAVAGLSFAQAPAVQAPAKDNTMSANTTAPVKKHAKKHKKAADTTTVKPAAPVATPSK